jgi:hypothetical protein
MPEETVVTPVELTPETVKVREAPNEIERFNKRELVLTRAIVLDFATLYKRLNEEFSELEPYKSDDYSWRCGVAAVFDDNVIITTDYGAYFYRHAYTVDADGNVSINPERVEVIASFTPVNIGQPSEESTEEMRSDSTVTRDEIAEMIRAAIQGITATRAIEPEIKIVPVEAVEPEFDTRSFLDAITDGARGVTPMSVAIQTAIGN